MTPDEQETIHWELEETNSVIDQYFRENLPLLIFQRKSNTLNKTTDFWIINVTSKKYTNPVHPYIQMSSHKIYIGIDNCAWELNFGDPRTPENIMQFVEKYCEFSPY